MSALDAMVALASVAAGLVLLLRLNLLRAPGARRAFPPPTERPGRH